MAASNSPHHDRNRSNTTRHTKEDALSDREYQLLLEGCSKMRDYYGFQARFVALVAGRLGMRAGEIAHMREDWVDWRRNMVVVPRHEPCEKGKDGGPCGYCRQQAQQRVEHNDDLALDDALAYSWSAKTDAAAREIPFDFDPRVSLAVERFFEKYDEYPTSRQSVNRRVTKAAETAPQLDATDVYPHALRATAATFHAARGLDVLPLQAMFGWADLSTAQNYIQKSGENTARALHGIHSR
jgi:integrase